jgi:WD40 repeat protein
MGCVNQETVKTLCEGQDGIVQNVHFSPDGKALLAVGYTCQWAFKVWDIGTGVELCSMDEKASNRQAIFLPNGKAVLYGRGFPTGTMGTLKIIRGEQEVKQLRVGGLVHDMTVSSNGDLALSIEVKGSNLSKCEIVIWNLATGREIRTLDTGHYASTARFSPDGTVVVGFDGNLKSWDIETGKVKAVYQQ